MNLYAAIKVGLDLQLSNSFLKEDRCHFPSGETKKRNVRQLLRKILLSISVAFSDMFPSSSFSVVSFFADKWGRRFLDGPLRNVSVGDVTPTVFKYFD